MDFISALPRAHVVRSLVRCGTLSLRRFSLNFGVVAACTSFPASAATAPEPPRFQLVGSGTLQFDQPVQQTGNVQLKAYLTPSDARNAASPSLQEGGGFALTANLSAASLVCYNDTIFRDDFDADGF